MIKRITIYLSEMFPLSSFLGSVLTALAIQLTYLKLYNVSPESFLPVVIPGVVLTAVSLLIRIMDEFKDYQDDLMNFPERPLPSGRVQKKDLIVLGFTCVGVALFLSMTSLPLLIWSMITLVFTFLMLKWFFIEETMRKSLPLAFITHHPIVVFNFVYLIIACTQMSKLVTFEKAVYVLPLCLIFTNWEIVRKIRAPHQETSYTTYSKLFGPRISMAVAILVQVIFCLTVFRILQEFNARAFLWIGFTVLQLLLMLPSIYFLVSLKLPRPLKPFAEGQILTVVGTLLIAALL